MSYLAEKNVIGSLLLDRESMRKIHRKLEPEMFTSEILSRAYIEFLRGYENGYEVNLVVLDEKLRIVGIPSDLLRKELKDCIAQTDSSLAIEGYANIVIRNHKARMFNKILNDSIADPDSIDVKIGQMITDLEALLGDNACASKTLAKIVSENKGLYFRYNEEEKLYLGFPRLDEILGGLEGGDMIVIGARPGVGKSAFVTQVAGNLTGRGKRIGYYNLEMQEKQVYERFVAAKSGIGITRLRRAVKFMGNEEERFQKANEELEKEEGLVIMTGSRTMSDMKRESRYMGYDVIIIDYLQLVRPDKRYTGNRYAEVGAVSKGIKDLAMSLNRVSEGRETKEPTMSELREAGDIEQDASVVMLMWNLSENDGSMKGFKVEKQRQGMTGKIVFRFDGDKMRFEESEETLKEAAEWAKVRDDDCPFP